MFKDWQILKRGIAYARRVWNEVMEKEVAELIIKINDFAKAILLDEKNITSEGIALTMAGQILSCGSKALEIISEWEPFFMGLHL